MQREHEMHVRRRSRNYGVVGVLLGMMALLFVVTIVKLGANAANPSTGVSWGESLMQWVNE